MRGLTPRQTHHFYLRLRGEIAALNGTLNDIDRQLLIQASDHLLSDRNYIQGKLTAYGHMEALLEELTATAGRRKRTSRDRPPGG